MIGIELPTPSPLSAHPTPLPTGLGVNSWNEGYGGFGMKGIKDQRF